MGDEWRLLECDRRWVIDEGFILYRVFRVGGGTYTNHCTTFKLEGKVTSLSESSQGEVGYNREKLGDFWEKSIAINQNIVS
jgi:hypothetical protein